LENLELLADQLDGLVPKMRDGGLEALRKYAEAARVFVTEDDSIGDPLKQHVLRVIAHLDWCLAHDGQISDSDLQEAVERLFASMVRTATHSKDKQKWFDWIMNNTVWPFTVNVAAATPHRPAQQKMLARLQAADTIHDLVTGTPGTIEALAKRGLATYDVEEVWQWWPSGNSNQWVRWYTVHLAQEANARRR
jgi:hypothetical protein